MSTQFDADEILAAVEEHIDALPARKRRKPYDDGAAEGENYGGVPVDATLIHLELNHTQQVELHLALFELLNSRGRSRDNLKPILAMLGLSFDSPANHEALLLYYRSKMPGGAA